MSSHSSPYDPIEPLATKALKGVVKHKLEFLPKVTTSRLVTSCILPHLGITTKRSIRANAYFLQRSMRYQYFRLMGRDRDKKLLHTYRLNCPPVGFRVTPFTKKCNRPRVCPWCFVRRWLIPSFRALQMVPEEIRLASTVVGWRRGLLVTEKNPLFGGSYGPHQWCDALATVQFGMPWPLPKLEQICFMHMGIQIVGPDCDFKKALSRRCVKPELSIVSQPKASTSNILKIMSHVTALPWLDMFDAKHIDLFEKLSEHPIHASTRLLRINNYRIDLGPTQESQSQ